MNFIDFPVRNCKRSQNMRSMFVTPKHEALHMVFCMGAKPYCKLLLLFSHSLSAKSKSKASMTPYTLPPLSMQQV